MNNYLDDEFEDISNNLTKINKDVGELRNAENERRKRVNDLLGEIKNIKEELNIKLELPPELDSVPQCMDDIAIALSAIPADKRKRLEKEFFSSVPPSPPFDNFDIFLLVCLGGMALLADFFLVGLPAKTKWVPKNEGGVIPTGWLSERLKSFRVRNDNLLSYFCKVPFDKSTIPNTDAGLNPYNHRLLTFGHDPSPIGMVFGLMDIVSGGMSGITRDGRLFFIPGVPPNISKILLAPLIWIGHLASDVATPMGIPVPGWTLTQILRIPAPGAEGGATIADVGRMMYEQGYDFRHYLAGAVVPALVEIVIRTYHFLRYLYPLKKNSAAQNVFSTNLAYNYMKETTTESHLKAMLFWGHLTAAAINVGKIAIQGVTGNYFSAARAINIAQWQTFALRTIEYIYHCVRDKKLEQLMQNRKNLDERWDMISSSFPSSFYNFAKAAPSLLVIQEKCNE